MKTQNYNTDVVEERNESDESKENPSDDQRTKAGNPESTANCDLRQVTVRLGSGDLGDY